MIIKNLIRNWYEKKLSIDKIERYCQGLEMPRGKNKIEDESTDAIYVSCVQREIRMVKDIKQYVDILYCFVKQAAEKRSQLIIFPEYNFFDLFGLIPGFTMINSYLNQQAKNGRKQTDDKKNVGSNTILLAFFQAIAEPVEKALKKVISSLAEGFEVYIYTGSYLLKENNMLYNVGSLYGPDGRCIGTQRKIHLTDFEAQMGIDRHSTFETHTISFGKVAFPICMDATFFETFRIISKMGADMVILPIANMEEYSEWKALRGIWPRVQEAYVYGFKASLTGWIAGMHFTGKAGIFAPIMMTPKKDGIIALSSDYEGNELVTGAVDISNLYKVREEAPYFGDSNTYFEKNYIKQIYYQNRV